MSACVEGIVFEGSVLVPSTKEEIVDAVRPLSPQEHVQERIVTQGVDTTLPPPVPPHKEEFVAAVQFTPQEHIQERIIEHDVRISVPVAKEEMAESVQFM